MTSEWARPECDVRSRNALAAGTEQGSILQTKGVFDVFRTTKILRRPGPKCYSMSRGRRRLIFFLVYFAWRKRDSGDAHFETSAIRNRRTGPRTNGKMLLSFIIAINMLI